MINKVGVYFKVFGLAKDNNTGEKDYAGVAFEFETKSDRPPQDICNELFEKFNNDDGKQALLNQCFLSELHTINDVVMITKEEYYKNYGE